MIVVNTPRTSFRSSGDNSASNARLASVFSSNARSAAEPCCPASSPKFNAALPWPRDPVARLWHATTLLREQRGDAHVAVLASSGLSGRECNVLHAAAGRVPAEMIMRSRDYDEEQWRGHQNQLTERGLLDGHGTLTDAGRTLKQHIEDTTDALSLGALDALDDGEVETLFRALTPITRMVVAAGDVPAATPMGLCRDDLDDDSAHLG